MRRLRWLLVVAGTAGLWLLSARWWRSLDEVPPEPATPWPPVPLAPAPPATAVVTPTPLADGDEVPPQPELPVTDADPAQTQASGWVDPAPDGSCPDGYPVKVKQRSRLYHLPGMFAYTRTVPDRCYPTAEAAEADGFTRAKR